ncbi:hypothetical protein PCAR4_720064 [Paraburkholderia caribensis]|nr:hypothetical protein PCAR4_720064 [Paraburkholderia caribensis]
MAMTVSTNSPATAPTSMRKCRAACHAKAIAGGDPRALTGAWLEPDGQRAHIIMQSGHAATIGDTRLRKPSTGAVVSIGS